jgi:penicillin-binding protein 1A
MENMTGGTLPAQTWHDIMIYAHQGLDVKPPYGVAPGPAKGPEVAAAPATADAGEATPPRPAGLSPRAAQVITEIGDLARIDKSRRAQRIEPISLAAQSASGAGLAVLPASAAQP